MFGKMATAAALALTAPFALSAPAAAQSYDALASFNAAQGTNGFSYGSYNNDASAPVFTAFTQNTGCVIAGTTCLRGPGAGLPSVFKSDGSRTSDGTVILPLDRLVVHPGEVDSFYVVFTASAAGTYNYTANFFQQDSNTAQHSVGISGFVRLGGAYEFFDISTVDAGQPELLYGFTDALQVGDQVGFIVSNNGDYRNDSTGFNFALDAAVPEPATWGMMILGFALVGGLARRSQVRAGVAAA